MPIAMEKVIWQKLSFLLWKMNVPTGASISLRNVISSRWKWSAVANTWPLVCIEKTFVNIRVTSVRQPCPAYSSASGSMESLSGQKGTYKYFSSSLRQRRDCSQACNQISCTYTCIGISILFAQKFCHFGLKIIYKRPKRYCSGTEETVTLAVFSRVKF